MSDPKMDPERLGALLNGRLTGDERAAALARLLVSDEDRDVFSDTAAVLRALEEEDAAPAVEAPASASQPRRADTWTFSDSVRRMPRWGWGALAAGIMLALALPSVLRRPTALPSPEQTALGLAARGEGLPGKWQEPWQLSTSRGERLPPGPRRAARAGVKHLHLVLAFATADASARADAAADAADLFRDSAPLREAYDSLAVPDATAEDLARTGESAFAATEREWFRLGAWAEAARLAAERNDEGFFRARATAAVLKRAAALPGLPDSARTAIEQLRDATGQEGRSNWPRLRQASDALASALTR